MNLEKRVCVVVLGDIGRSPRMQYHSLSFAKEGYKVDVVGYGDSEPIENLKKQEKVCFRYMNLYPGVPACFPRLLSYIFKVLWQSVILLHALFRLDKPDVVLVQNPPAIPTLPVCWFFCLVRRTKFVIDWHNYGYTLLGLSLGDQHLLVKLCRWCEGFFGKRAAASICVTKAMKEDLERQWGIKATVVYDRPAETFRSLSLEERHELFLHLSKELPLFGTSSPDTTAFTERFADGRVVLREDRPALLISSTSWTEDEDFGVLLTALEAYEETRHSSPENYPPLICAITGKGPLKQFYKESVESRQWQHVEICMPWLDPEDYPRLLASADLGVCLHTSSSGLDLPMKVVDMFGCGLPVCAIKFKCLEELVRHEETGLVFESPLELAHQLQDWFLGFPKETENRGLARCCRQNVEKFQKLRWHESWKFHAFPVFQ